MQAGKLTKIRSSDCNNVHLSQMMNQLSIDKKPVGLLAKLVSNYMKHLSNNLFITDLLPEVKMLNNLIKRYPVEEHLSELDLDILTNLAQINLNERAIRNTEYLHDKLFDSIISEFQLVVVQRKYFKPVDYFNT